MAADAAGPDTPRGRRRSYCAAGQPRDSGGAWVQLWPDQTRIEKRGTQNIMRALVARARPQRPKWAPRVFAGPQEPQVAPAPRPREPEEIRQERTARLGALLEANRVNMEAAKARAKEQKNALLTQLRASRPRTERDLAP